MSFSLLCLFVAQVDDSEVEAIKLLYCNLYFFPDKSIWIQAYILIATS
jgi:hypothetical protein